jgi:hypothetical protein
MRHVSLFPRQRNVRAEQWHSGFSAVGTVFS